MSKSSVLQKKWLLLFILLHFWLMWLPNSVQAQGPISDAPIIDWQELATDHFIIVYAEEVEGLAGIGCACGLDEAEFYAAFIDEIYQDLVAVFGVELETPINLRLFPTEESYYEVNPLAEQITGLIAHALNNRAEIAIALPRTRPLTEEEIINNIRHELTHFFASLLSDGKLTTGFQEGIAQYLEQPVGQTHYNPVVLELAYENQRLLTWADLDKAGQVFRDPQVAYPQALSMASFLIDRYGFLTFIEFIKTNAVEPGYRSGLEATYGKSADELEAEWLAYLPEYFAGRWQINSIYAYDLSRVTHLVEGGAYSAAEVELIEIINLLESTNQTEILAEAELLLARAHQGQTAGTLADEARQALRINDYPLTVAKANSAIATYEGLGYRERLPEIQVYIQRAELGQAGLDQLNYGEQLLDSLRFIEAEQEIYEATVLLQSLDNQVAAQHGAVLLAESTRRQRLVAYAMLSIGIILLIFNGLRRLLHQLSANPLEVEFT
jgi:hypothetical protein